MLRELLRVARPGAQFPDAGRLDAHLRLMGPAGSRDLHASLDVDPASGLPTIRQWLAVRAERELAPGWLRDHPHASSARADYYRALAAAEVLPSSAVEVHLRRHERAAAHYEVVHDRLDAASGALLRYTLQLVERGDRHVAVAGDEHVRPTRRFLNLVERHSGADAELTLLLVSDLPGVTVEEVVRGQIGPLHFAGLPAPALLAPVLQEVPGAMVLHMALERAGRGVAEDRCRDPFALLYRDTLNEPARAAVEKRRAALAYRVAKERRLVCTPSAEAPLKAALARAGAAAVVRSR